MKKSEKIILELVKMCAFQYGKTYDCAHSEAEWKDIYSEVENHSLQCFLYGAIRRNSSIPHDVFQQWKLCAMRKVMHATMLLEEQSRILSFYNDSRIKYVVIKGTSAGQYYKKPNERYSNDVDLLVETGDYEKAISCMVNAGYSVIKANHYHTELERNGFSFEIHHELPNMSSGKYGNYLRQLIENGVEDRKECCLITGENFFSLPDMQNGIVLLRHILQHMVNGIGLRQIIDWMLYVDTTLDDEKWKEYGKAYERCGLKEAAEIITRMCQLYIGLRTEGIGWCQHVPDDECKEIIDYILAKGNFGIKERHSEEAKGIIVLTRDYSLINMLKRFQSHGLKNWKLCQRCPAFRPFAWLHTLCRYVVYIFNRDNAGSEIANDIEISTARKKMLKKLRCTDKRVIAIERIE